MFSDLSPFVAKEKYRQKKAQVEHLTNQNQQLAQELAESNRQFREVEKELKQLLDIFSTFDITKEEGERLLRKAKNYVQKIQILEERVKGLLWLVQQLNQQNQTKDNEINELYANEIGWEIEKTLREKDLTRLKTTNQNWQISYQIAQAKLNQITEREEELLETSHEKLTFLTSQLANLTLSLNYVKWERDKLQAEFSQQSQKIDDLEARNDDLQNELAEEKRNNYRPQRNQRNPRWRDSEATLFGIEEEEQGENSNKVKTPPQTPTNSNWKSALWQKTKNLGLTALAAYGSYQTGLYQGSNLNLNPQNQLSQFNHPNPTQLINHHYLPVSYNQTHSWIENPLSTHSNLDDQFLVFSNPDLNNQQTLNKELTALRLNNTELANNQKPANLPNNWESELACLKDLETKLNETQTKLREAQKRPTHDQLTQAVNQEKDKYKNYIAPTDLESQVQQKGLVSQKTYNQRPNITLPEYTNLLNNQKPLDLPENWKSQLARIPELEQRPNISPEEFAKYKSPDQVAEIEKSARQAEADKYKNYINPANPTALNEHKLFTEDQAKKAIEDNNKNWINKGLINPLNQTELEQAQLVPKTKLEQIIIERDDRPNITLDDWENDYSKRPSNKSYVKTDLDNKTKTCSIFNQIKIDLELKLLTKSAKIEQLNSLLDTLKRKHGQVRNEKDEALRTQETAKKERDTALIERDTALLNLENFNQQLDNTLQELIRTQRKNRKLTKKLQKEQTQHTKTKTQLKEQNSYLESILGYLVKTGIAASSWKFGRDYGQGEMIIKHLENDKKAQKIVQDGLNNLVQQKEEAQQNQQQAEQERDQAQTERDHYRQQVENHRCPANSDQPPSQTQAKIIQQNNEQEIIRELNTVLHLNLKNPTLKQVISEIQSRIAQDPVVVQEIMFEAETKLVDTPFGEDLAVIKELEIKGLEELFPGQLEEWFIREIKSVQNYSQLVQVRNSFLAKHLAKFQQGENKEVVKEMNQIEPVKQNNRERYIWISLLVVSLVSAGGLLMKLKGVKRVK